MCGVCERIQMIKDGTNPYFVKELETGYVVIGDFQHFKGYTLCYKILKSKEYRNMMEALC